jgi:soluble lytic murein transglycosylase
MRDLGDKLGDHPALMIAGYNGGHGNVSRWLDERGDLPLDLWVEDIPYGQTRKYTKRVLSTFWTYNWLYSESRVPRLSFAVK